MKLSIQILSVALSALSIASVWYIASPKGMCDALFLESDKSWVKEMSPAAGSFIFNDRPTSYRPLKASESREADKVLRNCLSVVLSENARYPAPATMITALCNLASFCYREGRYEEATSLFQQAVTIRKQNGGNGSAELADLLSCLTLVHRASQEYEKATQCLSETLAIRKSLFGASSPEVAATYMELAQIAHDAGDDHGATLWEEEASKIASTEFVSKNKSPLVERPVINSSLTKGTDFLPQMLDEARAIIAELETQAAVREQARIAREKEEARKAREEAARVAAERAKALDLLNKAADDGEYSADAPGFATITGRVLYPVSSANGVYFITKAFTPNKVTTESRASSTEVKPLPIEVAICKTSLKSSIARKLVAYAEQQNQPIEQFGDTWPATRKVARPLMTEIGALVAKHKIPKANWLTESDDSGEYLFEDIPKGKYIVYAQLLYEGEYLYWLIPLEVKDKRQITLDILQDNVSHYVWRSTRDNHAAQL